MVIHIFYDNSSLDCSAEDTSHHFREDGWWIYPALGVELSGQFSTGLGRWESLDKIKHGVLTLYCPLQNYMVNIGIKYRNM